MNLQFINIKRSKSTFMFTPLIHGSININTQDYERSRQYKPTFENQLISTILKNKD